MKILVVRFSSIGDVVLTTPVIRCLKQQLPDAEIHYVTKKAFEPVLRGNPYIDKLICIEKSAAEVMDSLKNERYDFVADLHNNIRTFRLKLSLGAKSKAFPKLNPRKLLLTRFKVNLMPKAHVVDRYFEAVKSLGVHNDGGYCELFLDASDQYIVPGDFQSGYVALSLGAQYETKQMPLELITNVLSNIQMPLVLLGGPTDTARAKELMLLLPGKKMLNLAGEITLRQSAYVLSGAQALLTGDTGLMHIASCFGVKTVSVWGNTVPEFGMYPYAPRENYTIHEVDGLSCRPCSKIGYHSCPKKHFNCMHLQNPALIAGAIQKFTLSPQTEREAQ